jgi:hypothetical protein
MDARVVAITTINNLVAAAKMVEQRQQQQRLKFIQNEVAPAP